MKTAMVKFSWKNFNFLIKRDDLLKICHQNSLFTGNKIRKYQFLTSHIDMASRQNDLDVPLLQNTLVISYGGLQSNSMNALAILASLSSNCDFIYFVKRYPRSLQQNPIGNLKMSIEMGMKVIEINSFQYQKLERTQKTLSSFPLQEFRRYIHPDIDKRILWIPQGGALPEAEKGIQILCDEIIDQIQSSNTTISWKIFVSSGTGTTALFMARCLAKRFPKSFCEVVAIPCVGGSDDLKSQMKALSSVTTTPHSDIFPTILPIPPDYSPTPFAKPTARHFDIWSSLNEAAKALTISDPVEFDLIYAPKSFELLEESYRHYKARGQNKLAEEFSAIWKDYEDRGGQLIYYHCGGFEGNVSQLQRYQQMKIF